MISSVPYVPPDTIKNVAATRGQSVSLIDLFVVETARVGNCAGSDIELNSYSRPPKRTSLSSLRRSEFAGAEYRSPFCTQEKSACGPSFFQPRPWHLLSSRLAAIRQLPGLLEQPLPCWRCVLDCSFAFCRRVSSIPKGAFE